MADSKHTITINTKAAPDTSTPTQTVAPSQVTRPTFDQGERQSMVNKQAHSIRDEQAAQGISIPWGDALRQANEEWRTNIEAANALADTENQSVITPASQVISDEVVGPEILEDGLDFGPIDTDTIDASAVEEALDGIFDNINEVIKEYDPNTNVVDAGVTSSSEVLAQEDAREEADNVASGIRDLATTETTILSSPQVLSQEDAREEADDITDSFFGEGVSGDGQEPVIPTSTRPTFSDDDDVIDLEGLEDRNMQMGTPNSPAELDILGMRPDYGRRAWTGELGAAMEAGVSGSSPSAATAIQATGAIATHPIKVGRDAMAQQLEHSAMGAKVLTALGTGGEVVPTSDGGGEGGGDVSDVMSMGGGGGGGGGLEGMIGGAIDDIFAGPLKPVDMFIDVIDGAIDKLAAWTSAIEESYEEVMGFSGAMVGARVETDLMILQKKIERADELGGEFAEFESARGDLLASFEDLKTILLKIFMPIVKVGLRVLTKILDIIVWVLELLNDLKNWLIDIVIEIMIVLSAIPLIGDYAAAAVGVLEDIKGNTDKDTEPEDDASLGGWLRDPNAAMINFAGAGGANGGFFN